MRRFIVILLSFVLGTSGILKLIDIDKVTLKPLEFRRNIEVPIVIFVSVLEVVTALSLLRPSLRHGASIASSFLMATFTAIHFLAFARHYQGKCNCFGSRFSTGIGIASIFRNACLLILSVTLTTMSRKED